MPETNVTLHGKYTGIKIKMKKKLSLGYKKETKNYAYKLFYFRVNEA